ncbi:MAG: Aminoglycoside phosphotransferase [Caulobacteraceae bacterium]|nr:Aminoglycoside phosphotransferase [Caulobacteraceae bacterium]
MDAEALGTGIVAYQRQARFAGTTSDEWAHRLRDLIRSQPGVTGTVEAWNVRPVEAAAGGSNGTMLFDARYTLDGETQERPLVLRFLPAAGLFHRYDVRGQFTLQRSLAGTDVPVPPQFWLDEKGEFLTVPGYVMGQVAGTSTPMTWKASGLLMEATPKVRRRMMMGYVEALARIHALDWRALGLEWLQDRAAGSRPIEREANWYWDSLTWAAVGSYATELAPIRDWIVANEPTDAEVVLCHGDANLGNYLFDDGELTAVVDWEMAFLGAPECDLSFLRVGDQILQGDIPCPEGALSYDEIYAEYERASGRTLRHLPYFELFTAFRSAIISILAMKHFPPEVLEQFLPALKRSVALCMERARRLGVAC